MENDLLLEQLVAPRPSHIETVAYCTYRAYRFLSRSCRNRTERMKERSVFEHATSSIKRRVHKQVSETRKFFTSHAQIIFHFYLSFFSSFPPLPIHEDKTRPTPLTARLFFSWKRRFPSKKKRGRKEKERTKRPTDLEGRSNPRSLYRFATKRKIKRFVSADKTESKPFALHSRSYYNPRSNNRT